MVKVKNRPKKKMNWGLGLLALPGVLFLLAFSYAPLFGLIIPFKNIDYAKGIFNSDWAGFGNFKFFFSSQDAWRITRNTVLLNFMFILRFEWLICKPYLTANILLQFTFL